MGPESPKKFDQLVFTSEEEIMKKSRENEIDPNLLGKIKVLVDGKYVSQWLVSNIPIEEFIAERKEIAEKFKVSNLKTLRKREDHWYVNSMKVEEWLNEQEGIDREEKRKENSGGF